MSEPLPAAGQSSTASSLDEILTSSPTERSEAQSDNVLAPKMKLFTCNLTVYAPEKVVLKAHTLAFCTTFIQQ